MHTRSDQDASSAQGRRNDEPCEKILKASTLYGVLGVPRAADDATIKAEFRRGARQVHPDKNSSPLAGEAFKRLQRAYEVLSDPKARSQYEVTGEDRPKPARSPQHHYYYQHAPGPYGGGFSSAQLLQLALVPLMLSTLVSVGLVLAPGFFQADNVHHPWPYTQGRHKQPGRKQKAPAEQFVHLTRDNADATCGSSAGKLCVVLLAKASKGFTSREEALISDLRATAADKVRTSRGQSLKLTWATSPAVGKWPLLLPSTATLPWVVILKKSSVGLRAVAMPVPDLGAKTKNRLRNGVPELLQEIAAGSAKFEPVKGTVSDLFQR